MDVGGAALGGLRDDRVDELDDRRVVGRLAQVDDFLDPRARLALLDRLGDRVLEAVHAHDQRVDVLRRGDRRPHVEVGEQRDVVDREHVRRVRHRQQQRVLVDVGDRDGVVALRGGGAQQVGGAHIDLEHAEIEVIEAVPLGHRARELLGGDRLLVEQHALGRDAGRPGGVHGTVDGLGVGEPELDDHIGQEPVRAAAAARRGDAADLRLKIARIHVGLDQTQR